MIDTGKQSFDVVVVGSGASGGWACKRLAEAGLKVALLEAGRLQACVTPFSVDEEEHRSMGPVLGDS